MENETFVTGPGSRFLETPGHLLPDRCVHDPNLLDALEASVKSALELIYVDGTFASGLEGLQWLYDVDHNGRVDLSSEGAVGRFLGQTWLRRAARILRKFVQVKGMGTHFEFAGADTSQHQQPNIQGQLTIDGNVDPVTVSIMELKSEGIVRNFWQQILDCGERNVQLDGKGSWDE